MNKKIFENARFTPKGDVEANWKKAVGFVPLDKEIIIYKADENYSYARMKIGDGKTGVNDLPFVVDVNGELASKEWVEEQANILGVSLQEYVDNAINAINIPEIDQVYNANSENAQSGKAVAQAIYSIVEKNNEQDDKLAELEGKVTIATFRIIEANTPITLQNLEGVTRIDWGDGTIDSNLTHTYTNIGEYECKIYDVTTIGMEAFYHHTELVSLIIGNSVINIGEAACVSCYGLESVVIPDSVMSIGEYAFAECEALTSVTIPESVTNIEDYAFNACTSLINIIFTSLTPITYSKNLFNSCRALTHIYVPYGYINTYKTQWATDGAEQTILDKIDHEALISDINKIKKSQEEVTIATFYTYVGTKVDLQKLVGVTQIDWGDGTVDSNLTHTYTKYGEHICKIYGITAIGADAFYQSKNLTDIVIGNSVTSIGSTAFYQCDLLTNVEISHSVKVVDSGAFAQSKNLKKVIFKNPTPIAHSDFWPQFSDCTSLTHIYVPYGYVNTYKEKWGADGASQDILDIIVPNKEITTSDIDDFKTEIQEELVGKTDYLGTVTSMSKLSTIAGAGDYCRVSTEFEYDNTTHEMAHVGDILIAVKDNPTQSKDDWDLVHTDTNIDNVVDLTGDQEISGNKTFTADIKINTETVSTQEWVMQYIADNFATLMAQYLNSAEATENKPTAADISTVFNEETTEEV